MNVRHIKITVLITFALLFSFFLFNNITNFFSNLQALKSVFEMEGVFDTHLISWRAISSPIVQQIAFFIIIGWQFLVTLFCWMGTVVMIRNIHAEPEKFIYSKRWALLGLTGGFVFFMIGFVIIGSEWFNMWQSMWKNLQLKTLIYSVLLLCGMLFISHREE